MRKCRYCDFVSLPEMENKFDAYIDAVLAEMDEYKGEKADTVFIGGGTPSVLTPSQLERLIRACFDKFDIQNGYEFSIEVNPGTVDDNKIKTMLSNGVNRVSVGVQSFNDSELKTIGRIHDAQTAYNTVCRLNELGFLNINADIMTALPSQTKESLMHTIETAAKLPLTHISAYSLIIEDGTPLSEDYKNGRLDIPNEDEDRDMYAMTVKKLSENGFNQYEISNFAKTGFECRHNIKYWQCEEYIGIGAAAHSYVGEKRYFNTSDISEYISEYISGNFGRDGEILSHRDKISEFIFMGMRMNEGISENEFERRFGTQIHEMYGAELDKFINGGFIIYENGRYKFTDKGRNVSNSILCEFV